jgi:hypothetical protein
MIKKIIKILSIIFLILALIILYLSIFGVETAKFNNQIKNKVSEINKDINLDLKKIKITLNPSNFKVNIITLDAQIIFNDKIINLKSLKTRISLLELLKNQFSVDNLEIFSESINVRNLVSLIRSLENEPKLLLLEMMIQEGYLKGSIDLNFDKEGNIKNNYRINGFVKDLKLKKFQNNSLDKLSFVFNIVEKNYKFSKVNAQLNKIKLNSPFITIENKNNSFLINGKILNSEKDIPINGIERLVNNYFNNLNLKNLRFVSDNNFSFNVNKNFKISNFNINSEINLSKLTYKNNFESIQKYFPEIKDLINLKDHKIKLNYNKDITTVKGAGKILIGDNEDKIKYEITKKNTDKNFKISNFNINSEINLSKLTYKNNFESIQKYFPEIKDLINLKDHKIKLNYNKDITTVKGAGKILIGDNEDKIKYEITKKNKKYFFKKELEVKKNIFLINELKYEKENNKKALIEINGLLKPNNEIFFNEISLIENDNNIFIKDLSLDNKFKIFDIGSIKLDYKNYDNIYNQLHLTKEKNNYKIEGSSFDASKMINEIMNSEDDNSSLFSNLSAAIFIQIKKTYIDDVYYLNNLIGRIDYKKNKIDNLNLVSIFSNKKKIVLSIKTNENNEQITTLTTGYPKPLIKRYKFIKGFEEGFLDFYSIKKNGISNSLLVVDNFKIKEVPVFAKLLSLASLQGIADLLTGEGIRFTDFEMKFENKKGLMTIDEMYAIGPAVSILMDGYIETNKLVSLRGTLVPATTINRSIASIPLLGNILIGKKTGEGVFGVSFKVKGEPKKLKTTVNPIKSLTPRFITRTIEKLKKN